MSPRLWERQLGPTGDWGGEGGLIFGCAPWFFFDSGDTQHMILREPDGPRLVPVESSVTAVHPGPRKTAPPTGHADRETSGRTDRSTCSGPEIRNIQVWTGYHCGADGRTDRQMDGQLSAIAARPELAEQKT